MTHAATVVQEVEGLLFRQAAVEIDFEAFEMAVRRNVMWVAARAVEHRLNAVQILDRFHAKHHEQIERVLKRRTIGGPTYRMPRPFTRRNNRSPSENPETKRRLFRRRRQKKSKKTFDRFAATDSKGGGVGLTIHL